MEANHKKFCWKCMVSFKNCCAEDAHLFWTCPICAIILLHKHAIDQPAPSIELRLARLRTTSESLANEIEEVKIYLMKTIFAQRLTERKIPWRYDYQTHLFTSINADSKVDDLLEEIFEDMEALVTMLVGIGVYTSHLKTAAFRFER